MKKMVVHQILQDAAYQHAATPVVSGGTILTYEAIFERTVRLAQSFIGLGIRPGTVVGVMAVNNHQYFELHYALSLVGAIIHPINFRLAPEDILWTIQDAQDEWLFLGSGFDELTPKMVPLVHHVVWMGGGDPASPGLDYEALVRAGTFQVPEVAQTVVPQDIYTMFYTTGTTGRPKGIRYTHQQMLSGALQIAHHLALHDTGARLMAHDVIMPLIPFFHIHGWGIPFVAPYIGASLVLPERRDPVGQRDLIRRHQVTWANMVPTQLLMLLAADPGPLPLKILTGGSPLTSGLAQQASNVGIRFSLIYGGTDQLGSAISTAPGLSGPQAIRELSSHLTPFPMVRLEVRDESGSNVPQDGTTLGEVWVQSPWLPEGYVNNDEASSSAYQSGWFRTGDLAVRYPDGHFAIMDRITDAIKSGGEWITGSAIESIISEIPGVSGVAVIGVPDPRWGERPQAIITEAPGVDAEMVRDVLNQAVLQGRIPRFWVPDTIKFVDMLPMTSAGKINKGKLRHSSSV